MKFTYGIGIITGVTVSYLTSYMLEKQKVNKLKSAVSDIANTSINNSDVTEETKQSIANSFFSAGKPVEVVPFAISSLNSALEIPPGISHMLTSVDLIFWYDFLRAIMRDSGTIAINAQAVKSLLDTLPGYSDTEEIDSRTFGALSEIKKSINIQSDYNSSIDMMRSKGLHY